jgi:PAS domain S-box-containing protein
MRTKTRQRKKGTSGVTVKTSKTVRSPVRGDGRERKALKDQESWGIGFRGVGLDITERKKAEAEYQTIIRTAMDGFWLTDMQGHFLDVNDAYCRLIGYSRDELLNMSIPDVEAIDTAKGIATHIRKIKKVGYDRFETRHRRRDGEIVDVEISVNYLPIEGGRMFVFLRDITERKRMEEALRQSEERYRTLFNSKLDGICVMDETMKVLLVNQAAADIFGFDSIDEALGANPFDFIPPEERDRVLDTVKKDMLEHDLRQVNEFHLTNKSGKDIWVSAIGTLTEYQGKLAGLISFRDITEHKQAEEALRQSEGRYRTVLEEMEEGYFETDIRGNFTVINEATCRVLGYPREEIIGTNYRVFVTDEYVDAVHQAFNQVYRTGMPLRQFTWEVLGKDGGRKFIEASILRLQDQEGKIIGFRGVGRDITGNKKSEAEYQTIIRTAMDGFWLTDMQGHFLDVNEAYCRLTGYSRDELLNMSIPDIEAIEKPEDVAKRIQKVERVGYDRFETRHRRKDGEIVDVEVSINYLSTDGGRYFVFVRDITERKQVEELLANEAIRRRILIDQSRDGIVVLDENGKVYEANRRFAEMLGYSPEEVRGLGVWDWEFQFPREQVQEMIRTVDEKGDHFETRHRRKDGTTYDVEISTNGAIIGGQKLIFCVCRDITERKQAGEALRLSEQNLRDSVENSPLGIRVLSKEGKTLYANRALLDFWGYNSVEEFEAVPVKQRYTPEGYAEYMKIVKKRKQGEDGLLNYEVGVVRSDGQVKHLSATTRALLWNGEWQFQVVYQDITERKQAEEALAKSEERYRSVLEQMEEAYFEVDTAGNFTLFNDATCRQLGYSREELMGMNYRVYTFKDDVQHVYEAFNQVYRTGKPNIGLPVVRIRKDGSRLSTETSAFPLRNERGDIIGFRGIASDVTERKQAEETLANEAIRRRILIDQSRDGIVVLDENGKVYEANRRFAEMLGYSPEEVRGLGVWDWEFQFPREQVQEMIRTVDEKGDHFETRHRRKDGTTYDVEISTNGAVIAGQKLIFCVCRDITERKQAEEKIKKLYSLQTAIRYINESLLKVNDERALFKRVCRFLKDIEFIRFCWIGLVDKESLEVKPVAYSGFEDGYLSSLKISLDSSAYNRDPIGVAVKTRQSCVIADIENDSRFAPRREEALKRGYACCLAVPLIHDTEVIGVLSVYSDIKGAFGDAEVDFLAEAASDIALGIRTLRLRRELQESLDSLGKALEGTVSALASVAEVRDPYTSGHQQRVTRIAVATANEMGLPKEQIKGIQVAGTLHDVGKLYIPAEILSKPGKLSEVEFSLVKMHSQAGYDILKTVKFPWPIAQIVLQHHERLDGSGYPQGLKGEDILLEAKILAVADVVEAMASHRPYRPALGIGQALDEISQKSGILYDSEVVDACFRLFYDKEFKLD